MSNTLQAICERFVDETDIGFYGTADSMAAFTITWASVLDVTTWNTGQIKGWWAWRPQATANASDVVKAVKSLNDGVTGGVVSIASSTAYVVTASNKYVMLLPPKWHPTRYLLPLVNRALEKAWQWWRAPLSPVVDGDMEQAGTTHWSAVNATVTKDTTTAWVDGTQSLKVVLTSPNGGSQSDVFEVTPGASFEFTVKAFPTVGVAKMALLDVTNGLVVISEALASATQIGGWQDLVVTGTFPMNCTKCLVTLFGSLIGDTAYYDDVEGIWATLGVLPLPSWTTYFRGADGKESLRIYQVLDRSGAVSGSSTLGGGGGVYSSRSYSLRLVDEQEYQVVNMASAHGAPFIELSKKVSSAGLPLLLEAHRPFNDGGQAFTALAAWTDTTQCPLNLAVKAMKLVYGEEKSHPNRSKASGGNDLWQMQYDREQRQAQSALRVPSIDDKDGLAWMEMR